EMLRMRPSTAGSPLMTTVAGVTVMPVTRWPAGGGCDGGASRSGTVLLEAPGAASTWRFTEVTSRLTHGCVRQDERSMVPLLFESRTGWFGESIVLTLTRPGSEAVALRLVSQL